jgi:hypothetical protein
MGRQSVGSKFKIIMAKWTEKEFAVLREPLMAGEVAVKLGRSIASVNNKRTQLGIKSTAPGKQSKAATVSEDLAAKDETYWAAQYKGQNAKYEKLLKEQNVIERLVSRVADLAPRSYSAVPEVRRVARASVGAAQSAFLQFSDTHIGKVTSPTQTLSFGSYDFATFMARLKYLEESVISITTGHTTTAVPELVIAMLGDMLDGTLVHSNEAGQHDTIFSQFYAGSHAVAQFLRNIAPYFPKVRIYEVEGNHTRFQNQRRMPTKNRYSNFDKFFYALVRELVRGVENIDWTLDPQPYKIFEVQGHVFFTAHGDTLRGGDKTLGVPNHAIGRLVSTATQMLNKYKMRAPNYYLTGHLHREIVLPHATGSIMVNGGFPGVDEYGLSEMFTPADPSQKFFFVHPQYGRTASYDISLKFAEVDRKNPPYEIPSNFPMT